MNTAQAHRAARTALAALWQMAGGEPSALDDVELSGTDPVLPSSFHVGLAAQVSIAAAALAASEIWRMRNGRRQLVGVDMRAAAVEFRSERYLRIAGNAPSDLRGAITGVYRTRDSGHVRLHANFPHHRDNLLKLLVCAPTRDAVQAALLQRNAFAFETEAYEAGCVVAAMRTREQWHAHPQADALAAIPVLRIERIGDAPARPWPAGDRPLAGIRALDLTRIIAGPVGGRALAVHGADVMRIASPHLPFIDSLVKDTGRGKLSAYADLATTEGQQALRSLLSEADILLQAYRPGAITALGFGPEDAARIRPGIVYVSLSAYGDVGPWAMRRGFDSLVQSAIGFNHAEGLAAGIEEPKELPCQALDHASGYLLALGAMMARARQAREGGSWLVRVALAGTGRWLWDLGRVEDGFSVPDPRLEDVQDLLETSASPFGALRAVRHAARLSETPARWERPAVPLGTHESRWPS